MDDIFIIVIIICSCLPLGLILLFIDSASSRKNYILLEYIDYLEKRICKKESDKDLLKRVFILQRQNKYIVDTANREIKDYKKVLKGE